MSRCFLLGVYFGVLILLRSKLLAKYWSYSTGASAPHSMCKAFWCGDFGRPDPLCPALVWKVWCWSIRLGGVFWRHDSAVVATLLLSVNFWRRLCVAWVVGRMLGDASLALTLPSPLLWTWSCAMHSRVNSLDTKTKLGLDLPCSSVRW